MAVVLAAIGGVRALVSNDTPDPTHEQTRVKPVIRGLLEQFDDNGLARLGEISNFVVGVGWDELQPDPNGALAAENPIDRALRSVRSLGRSDSPIRLKVRVLAGIRAPEWAKNLGGPPFHITDPSSGRGGTVGRFWTPEFGVAYAELHKALAARYDAVAVIGEVTVARCMTVFAEPFLRQISYPDAADAYRAAGYTEAADRVCQREQIDAHDVWRRTRSGLAVNPYQYIGATGPGTVDGDVTVQLMRYCRDKLGDRCVLENNSIRWPPLGNRYTAMYDAMKRMGPPFAFQTAAASRIGDPVRAVEWAVEFGADAVELGARARVYSRSQLLELDSLLRDNDE